MKHNVKITIILLTMFLLTQLIGLFVVNHYINDGIKIPYGFDQRDEIDQTSNYAASFLTSLILSFIIAIAIIFLLMRVNSVWFFRAWFFLVVTIALGITLSVITSKLAMIYPTYFALGLAIILAYIKVFKKEIIVHNVTELLIYPGIATLFVVFLNLWTTVVLLIIISIYDIWAVWHSGIMQKMAKYQINTVGVFSGFFIPYADNKMKEKIKLLKLKYKNNEIPEKVIKKSKIKIGLAILGGGDVIFPIITAGVFFKTYGNFYATLIIPAFAALALLYLFVFGKKKKFYPAMPYITTGLLLGMIVAKLLL